MAPSPGSSPPQTAGDEDLPDFAEIDGREQYYIKKEAEINETADFLKDVQKGFRDMRKAVHQGGKQSHHLKAVVQKQDESLHQRFDKFNGRALFLNEQPKRQLGGGENLRLEIKKLKFNITKLEDDIRDLKQENEELRNEKDELDERLNAEVYYCFLTATIRYWPFGADFSIASV